MDKGIYTALSGGIAKSHELEVVSNNLANVNTPGFKRDAGTFNEYLRELRKPDTVEGLQREIKAETTLDGRPVGDKSFVEMDSVYTNFEQGDMQKTSRSLDVALQGNGFFEVLTPSGVRYTRQGNFSISPEGTLVTINGFPVLASTRGLPARSKTVDVTGQGAKVESGATDQQDQYKALPPDKRLIRMGDGKVTITEDGGIYQNGARLATISVEEFHENQWLEKAGNSYFRNTTPDNIKYGENTTKTIQGFLEGSNVNPIKEMTKLIEVTRAYESHMQAIKTYQEIDARTVNEIARER